MRTLHLGLRVTDLERSLAFYGALGYEVLGEVPETELGSLTMLKLPGDDFVTLELVHEPTRGPVDPGGLSHFVVQVAVVNQLRNIVLTCGSAVFPWLRSAVFSGS
jgi:lactoylglutathione lyase